ncbi:MAG: trigger factor [Pelagibacteraceae bacterium]
MKIEVQNKKGLTTTLNIVIDKKTIQEEMDKRLIELQSEVSLKGFRPGKVPQTVIKSQFGKAIYGEVIDKILRESSNQAIDKQNIKAAGQPKIDLKTFGEGKDLNYTLEINSLPQIDLANFEKYSATEYSIKVSDKTLDEKINEIAKNNKTFSDKNEKSEKGDLVIFDYSATVDKQKFEGSEGKNTRLVIGQDLFLKGFDEKLLGVKKDQNITINVSMPENYPDKNLANKKAEFICKIINVQKPNDTKVDDDFAKNMGAKDLTDLKNLISKQVSTQYSQALDSITKKEILDQIEKFHKFELPQNLIEQEVHMMTHHLKKEDIEKNKKKNLKIAESRIKLGLVLNEYGEKNNLKVSDDDVKGEIQKQIKGMPGQEKMIVDYYQKNPSAAQSLKGALYEEKIINLFKSKAKIQKKEISIEEAEKIITTFNKSNINTESHTHDHDHEHNHDHDHAHEHESEASTKIKKKDTKTKPKTKKVSKK